MVVFRPQASALGWEQVQQQVADLLGVDFNEASAVAAAAAAAGLEEGELRDDVAGVTQSMNQL